MSIFVDALVYMAHTFFVVEVTIQKILKWLPPLLSLVVAYIVCVKSVKVTGDEK